LYENAHIPRDISYRKQANISRRLETSNTFHSTNLPRRYPTSGVIPATLLETLDISTHEKSQNTNSDTLTHVPNSSSAYYHTFPPSITTQSIIMQWNQPWLRNNAIIRAV
jgi:hypothetical protein